jgi:hypothetical protein
MQARRVGNNNCAATFPSKEKIVFRMILVSAAMFATSIPAHAQGSLVGDWSGSYKYRGATSRDVNIGIELKIASVEGNVVTGSAKTSGGSCTGEYQMRGKLDGNNLGMISTNTAGAAGDCKFGFRATVDGNSIKGTVGNSDMTLTKK